MSTLIVITGASRGIGRSAAVAFAKDPRLNNLALCLIARNEEGLSQTELMVRNEDDGRHIKSSFHSVDLSKLDTLEINIKNIFQQQLDGGANSFDRAILINNAGSLGHVGSSSNLPSPTELQKNVDFNFTSAVWLSSYFAKYFGVERNIKCNIVNISSLCAVTPFKTMAMYCAGKAARDMWHKTLGLEQDNELVKVLNYAPGAIDTDMTTILSDSKTLDTDLSNYYKKSRDESSYIKPSATAERLVNLLIDDEYCSGDHIDYWDLEDK